MRAVFGAAVIGMAAIGMAFGAQATGAAVEARADGWSGWAENGVGGAVDCTDCVEEESIAISCERASDTVAVELIGLVPGEDTTGARLEVTLDIDGAAETRLAEIEDSEMFGPVPLLMLSRDDALFARLRAGRVLTLSTEGDRLEIPLTGAAAALDVMDKACR